MNFPTDREFDYVQRLAARARWKRQHPVLAALRTRVPLVCALLVIALVLPHHWGLFIAGAVFGHLFVVAGRSRSKRES